jgi:hypothetical protein
VSLPLAVIRAYRDGPLHGRLGAPAGCSTRALADIAAGVSPWRALLRCAWLQWAPFPSWTDPGPQGFPGVPRKGGGSGPHP